MTSPRPTYILLGPPGAGKSTYSKRLADRTGYKRIGSGAIIRAFCADSANKEVCEKMERDYAAGIPQSDEMTVMLIESEIAKSPEATGFIFDAFPLSMQQAHHLESILGKYNLAKPQVLYITASEEVVVERIANRKVCRSCNSTYGPHDIGYDGTICPRCGAQLLRRIDDKPEVVKKRYHEYETRLTPIKDFYQAQNRLVEIDGEPPIDAVWSEIEKKLL